MADAEQRWRGMAEALGIRFSAEEEERLVPLLEALAADLERLRAMPLQGAEPAFVPRLAPREP